MSSQVSGVRYQVKERPILFSTPMVQAILEGRKTITRRIIKPQPEDPGCIGSSPIWGYGVPNFDKDNFYVNCATNFVGIRDDRWIKCPYGKVGDILWVRETWFPSAIIFDRILLGYKASFNDAKTIEITTSNTPFYWKQLNKGKMIPSIHMPKEAARIWLEITDIRVERLQEISEEEAGKEGVERWFNPLFKEVRYRDYNQKVLKPWRNEFEWRSPISSFQSLWQSINGPGSWELNPWVWVVSFKVLSKTGKPEFLNSNQPLINR